MLTDVNELVKATLESLAMGFGSCLLAYIFGLPLGVLLSATEKTGLRPVPRVYTILSAVINFLRSIPFIILLIIVMPITRLITGTTIGTGAAIVPLVISSTPMVAQITAAALSQVDRGAIEGARACGANNLQIIAYVLLSEARPAMVKDGVITAVTIMGYSAMAGIVGGGGLGDLAIRYGYYRYDTLSLIIAVAILMIIIQTTYSLGSSYAIRLDKRK